MSLPAGVYTSHAMTTLGVNVTTPDSQPQYGNLKLVIGRILPVGTTQQFSSVSRPATLLPAAVYTSHAMTTLGVNVTTPDSGSQYGKAYPPNSIVLIIGLANILFTVAGKVSILFTIPPLQGFNVAGALTLNFTKITGATKLFGSMNCVGQVKVLFTPPANTSFNVAGEIVANFYPRAGQQTGCISGPDVPNGNNPQNAVH